MSSQTIFLISAGCVFGGALLGLLLSRVLPEHHLRDNSKDTVKVVAGTIATLAALVLGLLVGSAKSSFDATNREITQSSTQVILLDRVLADYGPETRDAREQLRRGLLTVIETLWPEEKTGTSGFEALERANRIEMLQAKLRALTPTTDVQRQLLSHAQKISDDLAESRWLVIEQAQGSLPMPFLIVLLFWLTMLHVSFGLFATRNATVITVLLLSAFSVSGAIFIILEMNHPLKGMIKVSSAPMRKALEHLGQ